MTCVGKAEGQLGEEDLGFGLDDEEGVGWGVAGGLKFLLGFVEGGGLDGEEDTAVVAADEVEAELLLDELKLRWHLGGGHGRAWVRLQKADSSLRSE